MLGEQGSQNLSGRIASVVLGGIVSVTVGQEYISDAQKKE